MPWVPRALYTVMVAALERAVATPRVEGPREGAASDASATVVPASWAEPDAMAGRVARETPAALGLAPLPPAVLEACQFYAFGVPEDESANRRRAEELARARKSPEEIVREIRQGANVDALFI